MLKKLMIGAALAALTVSPTVAQSYDPAAGSGNIVGPMNSPNSGPTIPAYNSNSKVVGHGTYAYARARHHRAIEPQ